MKVINKDYRYVGVNDCQIDLFEGQFKVPNGMMYNSYVLIDQKVAILDTVDINFTDEWMDNLDKALESREPDYLIVHHMEPDHSANIRNLVAKFPNITIVGNQKTFNLMDQFFIGNNFKRLVVKDGDELCLGTHTLKFIMAPMIHWPEVMMSFDLKDQVLFSADAFGKFGSSEDNEEWDCEARRYYFGIVGKYGVNVQMFLKKVKDLSIKAIYPLHGPILDDNIEYYVNLYNIWSSYQVETEGVLIAYTSIYGNTKKAAMMLKDFLIEKGCPKIEIFDLARDDMFEAIEGAFRYSKLVLATTTYNNSIFPDMEKFIRGLIERNYQNRKVAIIENGSWCPVAYKTIAAELANLKNISFVNPIITIKSSMSVQNIEDLKSLADHLK